jgi:hypothetical protein
MVKMWCFVGWTAVLVVVGGNYIGGRSKTPRLVLDCVPVSTKNPEIVLTVVPFGWYCRPAEKANSYPYPYPSAVEHKIDALAAPGVPLHGIY